MRLPDGAQATEGHVETVRAMCARLVHRGPDDSGFYAAGSAVLGMRRLSIIDVEGGHQPIGNEDGSVQAVLNGEIYNYRELRCRLAKRGHRFATASDTEVLVHLYEERGIELVHDLNGMYAFALWDNVRRRLFLVRDRLGIKPVYYSRPTPRSPLVFASEIKALLAGTGGRRVDLEAIAEYLAIGYISAPRTPFRDIHKLPPGCYLSFDGRNLEQARYWEPPTPVRGSSVSVDGASERIRDLVEDALKLQLRADVPVGLFASGGLDSSAIMWGAARNEAQLDAFLCEFDHLKRDSPYARLACRSTGMRLREEYLDAEAAANLVPRLVWYLDEPLADPATVPTYLIARTAAKHVKVILNGTGGDEIFGGYQRYNLRSLLPPAWSRRIGTTLSGLSGRRPASAKIAAGLDYRQRYFHHMCLLDENEARRALGLDGSNRLREHVSDLFRQIGNGDPAASMMFVDLHMYAPGDLFPMLDRMTMAVSLEARVPLLDHRLVEFMASIAGDIRMKEGELKWLLRNALRGHLPDGLLDRPKQGFAPPVARWMEGPFGIAAERIVMDPGSRLHKLAGSRALTGWTRHGGSDSRHPYRLWSLLTLELWWRSYVDGEDLTGAGLYELA